MKKLIIALICLLLVACSAQNTSTSSIISSSTDSYSVIENTHHQTFYYSIRPATSDKVSQTIYRCSCGKEEITYGKWCPCNTIQFVSSSLWEGEIEISYEATVYLVMGRSYDAINKIDLLKQMKQYVPSEFKEIRNPDYYSQSQANYFTTYYMYEENVYLSFTTFLESDEEANLSWIGLKIETFIN